MSELTRRRFLTATSVGAAAVASGLAATSNLVEESLQAAQPPRLAEGEELVAHVRSLTTGEMTLLLGTTQVVYRDRVLAQRLAQAAARAGK